jgi:hypothetical protein
MNLHPADPSGGEMKALHKHVAHHRISGVKIDD